MNYEEIKAAWNAQADEYNDWTTLSADEIVEFAMSIEREECAKIADESKLNSARIWSMHLDDSPSRDSMFARSIEAGYIANEIRSKA